MENLAMLVMKKDSEIRISCRSHRYCKEPSALDLAKLFEGGGHTEAAGFKMNPGRFKSSFKVHSLSRFGVNIDIN
jgi:nanoRNase/pAp phosphatase (c-di-AMP/oligoRNAs hydrolase)